VAGLENWDQLTPRQRAVFFCCDGLKSNAKLASQKTQAIGICGQDIFDRYYLDNGTRPGSRPPTTSATRGSSRRSSPPTNRRTASRRDSTATRT